jgi:hypothetical protein
LDKFDAATITNWISLLHEPGEVVEVRLLNTSKKTISGYFDDFDKLAAALKPYDGVNTVYATLNPIKADLLARACNRLEPFAKTTCSDGDVTGRRWLFIDFDPVRASGISSTDEEKEAAKARALAAGKHLKSIGFPRPVLADSGNGWHLLYRIDTPNDEPSRDLIDKCLQALDLQFTDSVVAVDRTTFNAARIDKVYGTVAVKGDNMPARPHRRAVVDNSPKTIEVVSMALLQQLAATLPPAPPKPVNVQGEFDLERWIANAGLSAASSGAWGAKGRKWILNPCPWDRNHTDNSAVIVQFDNGAIAARCHHNGCTGRTWQDLRLMFEPDAYDRPEPARVEHLVSGVNSYSPNNGRKSIAPEPVPADEAWECPMPIGGDNLPAFPMDSLPHVLADHAAHVAESVQVPVDMTGMLALAAVAAINSRRARLHVGAKGSSHIETLNLYMVIASDPGTRKSSAMTPMMKPLASIEDALMQQHSSRYAADLARFEADEKHLAAKQSASARMNDYDRENALREIEKLAASLTPPMGLPRLLVQDITMEELFYKLADQEDNCIANMDTEGGVFSIIKGQYAGKNSAPNMDIYLKAWSADRAVNDRVSKGHKIIPAPMLTMGLMVQPGILRSLAEDERLKENGFLGRFLYSVPPNIVGTRFYRNTPTDHTTSYAYERAIRALYDLPKSVVEGDPGRRYPIHMDPEAIAVHIHCYDDIERRMAPDGDLSQVTAWASKLQGNVARIAANLHMVKHIDSRAPWEALISGETMAEAWGLGYYCIPHAMAAFGLMRADTIADLADRIIKWMKRHRLREFTLRDAWQAHHTTETKDRIELALMKLTEHSYVRLEAARRTEGRGRPPKPAYAVNPCIYQEETRPKLVLA